MTCFLQLLDDRIHNMAFQCVTIDKETLAKAFVQMYSSSNESVDDIMKFLLSQNQHKNVWYEVAKTIVGSDRDPRTIKKYMNKCCKNFKYNFEAIKDLVMKDNQSAADPKNYENGNTTADKIHAEKEDNDEDSNENDGEESNSILNLECVAIANEVLTDGIVEKKSSITIEDVSAMKMKDEHSGDNESSTIEDVDRTGIKDSHTDDNQNGESCSDINIFDNSKSEKISCLDVTQEALATVIAMHITEEETDVDDIIDSLDLTARWISSSHEDTNSALEYSVHTEDLWYQLAKKLAESDHDDEIVQEYVSQCCSVFAGLKSSIKDLVTKILRGQ